ncbi:hypothetical protein NHX12_029901, partial [Muraenolepis orangiensis]
RAPVGGQKCAVCLECRKARAPEWEFEFQCNTPLVLPRVARIVHYAKRPRLLCSGGVGHGGTLHAVKLQVGAEYISAPNPMNTYRTNSCLLPWSPSLSPPLVLQPSPSLSPPLVPQPVSPQPVSPLVPQPVSSPVRLLPWSPCPSPPLVPQSVFSPAHPLPWSPSLSPPLVPLSVSPPGPLAHPLPWSPSLSSPLPVFPLVPQSVSQPPLWLSE